MSGITVDGLNAADFSVTSAPVSPVAGPTGSTTFTVAFNPTGLGTRTAVMHIASNVYGTKNPYDITLSGLGIDISVEQPALTVLMDGGVKEFADSGG